MTTIEIQKHIRDLTLEFRKFYYTNFSKQAENYTQPFGGNITESIGPWAEFILKGRFCNRSLKGLCSPCFYSRFPKINGNKLQIENQLLSQANYVIDNFKKLIIENQQGIVTIQKQKLKFKNNPVCFVFTPTGSYFDSLEYPQEVRIMILKKLSETSIKYETDICIYIESHAEDFNKFDAKNELGKIECDLLQQLNARIIFGFESQNEFARNTLYNKKLKLNDYLKAINKAKSLNFPIGSFVFSGIVPLNNFEVINDTKQTINFLSENKITPVLMFNNIQPFTISELLYQFGRYKMIEPRTVLEIIKYLVDVIADNDNSIDKWLIADPIGGPPEPLYNIFSNKEKITCEKCTKQIYDIIVNLRKTKNKKDFIKQHELLTKCECHNEYKKLLETEKQNKITVKKRISDALTYIGMYKQDYLQNKIANFMIDFKKIRAELLCYGVQISEELQSEIEKTNPYIREKGFAHAINLTLNNEYINTCMNDSFCTKSPFSIQNEEENLFLFKNNKKISPIEFVEIPKWCLETVDNIQIGSILRPHSDNCVGCWIKLSCNYNCGFCCLANYKDDKNISIETICKMAEKAIAYNPNYEFAISGGVLIDSETTINYYIELCKRLKEVGVKYISVEVAPPENIEHIAELHNNGANAIIMNLEVFDTNERLKICPSKGKITNDYYEKCFKKAVSVFGKGNVSSVLIYGIQENNKIIEATNFLTNLDVIPTIIPFKPIDDCSMNNTPISDADDYIQLCNEINDIIQSKQILSNRNNACISCNGCALI